MHMIFPLRTQLLDRNYPIVPINCETRDGNCRFPWAVKLCIFCSYQMKSIGRSSLGNGTCRRLDETGGAHATLSKTKHSSVIGDNRENQYLGWDTVFSGSFSYIVHK